MEEKTSASESIVEALAASSAEKDDDRNLDDMIDLARRVTVPDGHQQPEVDRRRRDPNVAGTKKSLQWQVCRKTPGVSVRRPYRQDNVIMTELSGELHEFAYRSTAITCSESVMGLPRSGCRVRVHSASVLGGGTGVAI